MIPIGPGVKLVVTMSIGQNRWMFQTQTLEPAARIHGRPAPLRLGMPTEVERCMRRNFCRTSTTQLCLPKVECWPLLDPASAVAAEVANRAQIVERVKARAGSSIEGANIDSPPPILLPDVGPKFHAQLMNLGGGGTGLLIDRNDSTALDRSRFFWIRIDLTPQIPLPLGITGRLVHTHIDSSQNLYAGIAFDWSFNAGHRDFVIDQISGYLASIQQRQKSAA